MGGIANTPTEVSLAYPVEFRSSWSSNAQISPVEVGRLADPGLAADIRC